jgi:hypothetical protein
VNEQGAVLEDGTGVLNVTWFSDEAHFHLDGYSYKQHVQFRASVNPTFTVANPIYAETVTERCSLPSDGMLGPVFTCDVHLIVLSEAFVTLLMGYGISMNSTCFQQDGSRPEASSEVFRFFHVSLEMILWNRYPALFEEGF